MKKHSKGKSKEKTKVSRKKEQQEPAEEVKLGRNDPCHCGSGKKYKRCCLEKDQKKVRSRVSINQTVKYF